MLPAEHRLDDAGLFRLTTRRGTRRPSRTLVLHLLAREGDAPPLVGFVVSRAVGNAVVRNRVKRRLRHLAREHVSSLPGSCVLVVRALPGSAAASSAELGRDLSGCLADCLDGVRA